MAIPDVEILGVRSFRGQCWCMGFKVVQSERTALPALMSN